MWAGMVWAVAFMVWAVCKYSANVRQPSSDEDESSEPEPMWKETKTSVEVDRETLKEILKDMGMTDRLGDLEKALTRDYSALMKRMDEIRRNTQSNPPPHPPTEGGLS